MRNTSPCKMIIRVRLKGDGNVGGMTRQWSLDSEL